MPTRPKTSSPVEIPAPDWDQRPRPLGPVADLRAALHDSGAVKVEVPAAVSYRRC